MKEQKIKLTETQLDQLRCYCDWIEKDGTYYGNREQFEKRHSIIRAEIDRLQKESQPK